MKMPKSVIDLIWPLTLSPFLKFIENSSQGLGRHCFIPREMRRRSSSISRIMTSTSSPSATTFEGCTFLLRSEEHTSELQSLTNLVCRLLLEKKNSDISKLLRFGQVVNDAIALEMPRQSLSPAPLRG